MIRGNLPLDSGAYRARPRSPDPSRHPQQVRIEKRSGALRRVIEKAQNREDSRSTTAEAMLEWVHLFSRVAGIPATCDLPSGSFVP